LKELSIFVDESGDFGTYLFHSPYYIVTLVFHDQSIDISENIKIVNDKFLLAGLPVTTVHSGPLIRRENEYDNYMLKERRQIFNILYYFTRAIEITYHPIIIEKKELTNELDLTIKLTKQLSTFIKQNFELFAGYERIVIYYDYGQHELTRVLVSVMHTVLSNVEFKKVSPAKYKLFQAADMLCTLELLNIKAEKKMLSNSEINFFTSAKNLQKSYIRAMQEKRFENQKRSIRSALFLMIKHNFKQKNNAVAL